MAITPVTMDITPVTTPPLGPNTPLTASTPRRESTAGKVLAWAVQHFPVVAGLTRATVACVHLSRIKYRTESLSALPDGPQRVALLVDGWATQAIRGVCEFVPGGWLLVSRCIGAQEQAAATPIAAPDDLEHMGCVPLLTDTFKRTLQSREFQELTSSEEALFNELAAQQATPLKT